MFTKLKHGGIFFTLLQKYVKSPHTIVNRYNCVVDSESLIRKSLVLYALSIFGSGRI